MKIKRCEIDGILEIQSETYADERGWISRAYDQEVFSELSLNTRWVQDSHSRTRSKNTLRGIYVSLPPHCEGKLVKILRGRMQWVTVDLRMESATYSRWHSFILDGDEHNAVYADRGFAHGCLSLSDDCDLLLKSDNTFSAADSTGIAWNDSDLGIQWNLIGHPMISPQHAAYQSFQEYQKRYGKVIGTGAWPPTVPPRGSTVNTRSAVL
jgi:dTDP-4-dehydrorhamnose 3,5-epimerase